MQIRGDRSYVKQGYRIGKDAEMPEGMVELGCGGRGKKRGTLREAVG